MLTGYCFLVLGTQWWHWLIPNPRAESSSLMTCMMLSGPGTVHRKCSMDIFSSEWRNEYIYISTSKLPLILFFFRFPCKGMGTEGIKGIFLSRGNPLKWFTQVDIFSNIASIFIIVWFMTFLYKWTITVCISDKTLTLQFLWKFHFEFLFPCCS